jgi:MATE family multidrug resistance protein
MTSLRANTWRPEAKALLTLAGPLVINNLAIAGMQFADTVMSGQLGAKSLAAVAVGGSVWYLAFSMCMGVLMAIAPIVARHFGANDLDLIGRYTRQGIYLAVLMGVPLVLFGQFAAAPFFEMVGIDPEFRDLAAGYTGAIFYGAPGILIFLALRYTTEGIGFTRPIMYTSVVALTVNVFLNYVLMFGHFGAPALGAVGCGYASAITMWLIMIVLAVYMMVKPRYRSFHIFSKVAPMRRSVFKEIGRLGLPISVTITAEGGLFSAVTILIGTRGAEIAAAHQIAISFSVTAFMIPLAISAATTIRVGQLLGAGKARDARSSGTIGIAMCAVFMSCTAILFLIFREAVVGLYTSDIEVQGIAISLLFMAAIFQVADGVQVGAAGALRGYKDTVAPMLINLFAFWVVAFPLAYLTAISYQSPPAHIWAAFVAGLGVAAILLTGRYFRLSRPPDAAKAEV